jgi:predicted DNA-binding WGR domain protein
MDNLLTVALEAHNTERNDHRLYEVRVGRDLLNDWTVTIRYSRVGQRGREERFGGAGIEPMAAIIKARIKQRLSAPRRIGCSYRLARLDAADGVELSRWLPMELLARFAGTA